MSEITLYELYSVSVRMGILEVLRNHCQAAA